MRIDSNPAKKVISKRRSGLISPGLFNPASLRRSAAFPPLVEATPS
jgi:hypothetical protein